MERHRAIATAGLCALFLVFFTMPDATAAYAFGHSLTAAKLIGAVVLPLALWQAVTTRTPIPGLLIVGSASFVTASLAWYRAPLPADSRWLAVITVILLGWATAVFATYCDRRRVARVALLCLVGMVLVYVLGVDRNTGTPEQAWTQRGAGPFYHPNVWAAALLVATPPLIASATEGDIRERFASGLAVFGVSIAVLQSASRAAAMVWLLALVGLFTLRNWRWIASGVVAAALASPFVANLAGLTMRMRSLANPDIETGIGHASLAHRADLTAATWDLIWSAPVLGSGFGALIPEVVKLRPGAATSPHNTWLGTWAEQGAVGLLVWLAILGLGASTVLRLRNAAQTHEDNAWWRGLAIGLTSWALLAFTLDLGTFKFGWLTLGLAVGTLNATTRVTLTSEPPSATR